MQVMRTDERDLRDLGRRFKAFQAGNNAARMEELRQMTADLETRCGFRRFVSCVGGLLLVSALSHTDV